jgi:glutamine amidotransferase-like uncharacterized protein
MSHFKQTISIYNDIGVSKESLEHTIDMLKQSVHNDYDITLISAKKIINEGISNHTALFIMPGGADIPYSLKLAKKGNAQIRSYVEKGGSFLGICAGSYYGAACIEFDKEGGLEVIGVRELKFFDGCAVGPYLVPYNYTEPSGARAPCIKTIFHDCKETRTFYNGGGTFTDAESFENTTILATYEDNASAIIHMPCEKGNVILSALHFEYNPLLLDERDPYLKHLVTPLLQERDSRRNLTHHILQLLGVTTHDNHSKSHAHHTHQSSKQDTPSSSAS